MRGFFRCAEHWAHAWGDGAVGEHWVTGPANNASFDVTVHHFAQPGTYQVCWRPGPWRSNTLEMEVLMR